MLLTESPAFGPLTTPYRIISSIGLLFALAWLPACWALVCVPPPPWFVLLILSSTGILLRYSPMLILLVSPANPVCPLRALINLGGLLSYYLSTTLSIFAIISFSLSVDKSPVVSSIKFIASTSLSL